MKIRNLYEINEYLACPMKVWIKDTNSQTPSSSSSMMYDIVKKELIGILKSMKDGNNPPDIEFVKNAIRSEISMLLETHNVAKSTKTRYTNLGVKMVDNFFRKFLGTTTPFNVIDVNTEFDLSIYGHPFKTTVDVIIESKSNKKVSFCILHPYEVTIQSINYSASYYLLDQRLEVMSNNKGVNRLTIFSLQDGAVYNTSDNPKVKEQLEEAIRIAVDGINNNTFYISPSYLCKMCSVSSICQQ